MGCAQPAWVGWLSTHLTMRKVETCPFRRPIDAAKGDHGKAICGHLIETSGVRDPTLAEVGRDVCEHCCTQFEPQPLTPNPAVASRLVHLADKIIRSQGVEGCSPEEARKLKKLGISHLQVMAAGRENCQQERIHRDGLCFYLGSEMGRRHCQDCHGGVELKTFGCAHELHGEITLRDCRRCPDYDQRLRKSEISQWTVGVTTAPRRESTLERSLESLAMAGWAHPHVFAEPGSQTTKLNQPSEVTLRRHTLGAWPNFYLGLMELVMREPHADAYLMCQDDVIFASGLRRYLEESLWPAEQLGVISLHTASHQDRGDVEGFYPTEHGWDAWGAQAYVFPNPGARAFLRNARVLNHRHRGPRDGKCNVDSVVGQWCQETGFAYYLHTPSLTQHIGDTSTLWETARTQGRRRAATFIRSAPEGPAFGGEARG